MACNSCRKDFNPCAMRKCPKTGQTICRYCCMKCPESYHANVGEGCRVLDGIPKKEVKKVGRGKNVR